MAQVAPQSPEQQMAEDIMAFRDDMLGWVMYVFPWGVAGTALEDFPEGPDDWQRDLMNRMSAHIKNNDGLAAMGLMRDAFQAAVVSGHGIGKSTFMAWLVLFFMSTRPYCKGVVTANTATQLEGKTWAELSKWHRLSMNFAWFKYTATKFYCLLDPDGEKNWMFECVPWSEERTEAFAGLHNANSSAIMLFDEASAISDKIWEVSEGAMTDGEPFWFAFGNGTRNTGRFKECFGRFRHRWVNIQVDSRQVRITNKAKIQEWIDDYGEDSDFVRVRVRGMFPRAGSMQFIAEDIVDEAGKRDAQATLFDPFIIGVDVARFGDDASVIYFRKGRDARTHPPVELRGIDTMGVAARVAEEAGRFHASAVFVDGTGVGGGVVDRLRQLEVHNVIEIQFGGKSDRLKLGEETARYANKRAEMWGNMRDWLKGGAILDDPKLKTDLIGVEYGFNKDNAIQLEKKEDMKKRGLASPDFGDALALTFAYPVAQHAEAGRAGWQAKPNAATSEYDPINPPNDSKNMSSDYDPINV